MTAAAAEIDGPYVDHALSIVAKVPGARVFPIKAGAKCPPLVKDWPNHASSDPAQIRRWWERWPDANIGVTGAIVVDVDVRDGKPGIASMKALEIPAAELRRAMVVDTPSGGMHLYFLAPDGARMPSVNGWRCGVDIKADGGYVLGPGSCLHGDGGAARSYSIAEGHDRNPGECPARLLELLAEPRKRAASAEKRPIGELDSHEAIERATAFLEARRPAVEGENGDLWTVTTANSVIDFGISADMCHDLMAEHWNDRCSPPWELEGPNSLRTKVDSAYKTRLLPPGVASPEAEFGAVVIPPVEVKRRPGGKWLYRHGDPVAFDKQWLLYRRLPLVGTTMIVGPSGGGKTFFCADLARAVAKGEPFFGVEPDERGGVALFAAEGVSGMPGRLSVLSDTRLPIWAEPVASLRSGEEQRRVFSLLDDARTECLKDFGCPIRVIAIDTLAASGLLEDENDNAECARAVKFLEQLASRYDCLVIVTHHPPKNGSGARGGSALHAGFDTVVEIHYDGKQPIRRAECTKSRDAPTGDWGCFKLEQHVLGFDDRGREETTCTLCVATSDARSAASLVFADPTLVDTIVGAVGDKVWRKDAQSSETSIIDVIAKCAELNVEIDSDLKRAKLYLGTLLASGALVEGKERIGGRDRPIIRAPRLAVLSADTHRAHHDGA